MKVLPNLSAIHAKQVTIMSTWHGPACVMLRHNKERIAVVDDVDNDDADNDDKDDDDDDDDDEDELKNMQEDLWWRNLKQKST